MTISVCNALNDSTNVLPSGTTAEFSFLPQIDLENLGETPKLYVVPRESRFVTAGRDITEGEYIIDVGLWAKLANAENDAIAPAHQTMQNIADWALRRRFGNYICFSLEFQTLYDPGELLERSTFASVVSLTLRGTE